MEDQAAAEIQPGPSSASPPPSPSCWSRCGRILRSLVPVGAWQESRELIRIGGPVFVAYLLGFLISVVSSIFCGHLGKVELDAVTLAVSIINVTGISVGTGLASVCDTLMSQTYGSKNMKQVGTILQRGVLILLLCCFPCWAVFVNMEQIQTGPRGLQAILLPQVVTAVVANILNVVMNAICLYAFNLGVVGSAWANTVSRNTQALLLFLYVWWKNLHQQTWGGWTWDCLHEWGPFVRLALPSMLMLCIEWWTFEIGSFLAGVIIVVDLGAQSIIYELATIAYLLPQGMSVASSVRVGNALGAGDADQARKSCLTGLLCTGVFAVVFAILLAASKDVVAYIFTSDKEIVLLVSKVMLIFVPFHLMDAIAATCRGVLRGAGKQKIGAIANAIGYYAIGLPIGITLMFVYKMGVMGLWCGLIICISVQAFSFVVVILRADWKKAAEEAQIRAGLTGHLGTASADHAAQKPVPLATSLTLEADVPNEVALGSAVYRSESQPELQLIPSEEVPVRVVSPAGGALLRKELCFRRGLALLAAVVVLMAGVTVQLLTRNG